MPDATQKIDTGLTMGLMKILHRQVGRVFEHAERAWNDVSVEVMKVH